MNTSIKQIEERRTSILQKKQLAYDLIQKAKEISKESERICQKADNLRTQGDNLREKGDIFAGDDLRTKGDIMWLTGNKHKRRAGDYLMSAKEIFVDTGEGMKFFKILRKH